MTALVQKFVGVLDHRCIVSGKLSKGGCTVSLRNAPAPRLVVDLDKPHSPLRQNQTRCDYLFVANNFEGSGLSVALELKRGGLDVGKALGQLRAGAEVIEQVASSNEQVEFYPVVAYGNMHKAQWTRLKQGKVQFRGRPKAVRSIKCGAPLLHALGS